MYTCQGGRDETRRQHFLQAYHHKEAYCVEPPFPMGAKSADVGAFAMIALAILAIGLLVVTSRRPSW